MKLPTLIAFSVLGVALAQGPNRLPRGPGGPGVPGRFEMPMQPPEFGALKTYLSLTDAQIQQMRQAGEEARNQAAEKVKTILPQIRQKRTALKDLLAKDTSEPAAVGKVMLEIQALRKQVRQSQEAARNSQLNVLTAEQKTKLKAIEDAAALPAATREAIRLGLVPQPRGGPGAGMMGQGPGMRRQGRGIMGRGPGMMESGGRLHGQGFGPMDGAGPRPGPAPSPCPCQGGR
jgi:Spy/CpxP family protein refolding chaperone